MPTQTTSVVLATLQGGTAADMNSVGSTTMGLEGQDDKRVEAHAATIEMANAVNLANVATTGPFTTNADTAAAPFTENSAQGTCNETALLPIRSKVSAENEESSSAPPNDNKALFKHLVKILEVTPEQAAALKDSRFVAQEMDEILKETLSVLTELQSRLTQCGEDLDTEFNNVRTILTPSQSAKFLVWVSQNKACMHMLNELWSKVYPSSQKNGSFGDDITLAPSVELSP
jgi:hypothetical protein